MTDILVGASRRPIRTLFVKRRAPRSCPGPVAIHPDGFATLSFSLRTCTPTRSPYPSRERHRPLRRSPDLSRYQQDTAQWHQVEVTHAASSTLTSLKNVIERARPISPFSWCRFLNSCARRDHALALPPTSAIARLHRGVACGFTSTHAAVACRSRRRAHRDAIGSRYSFATGRGADASRLAVGTAGSYWQCLDTLSPGGLVPWPLWAGARASVRPSRHGGLRLVSLTLVHADRCCPPTGYPSDASSE